MSADCDLSIYFGEFEGIADQICQHLEDEIVELLDRVSFNILIG